MNAPPSGIPVPRPPRHIEAEMEAAGAAGDDVRLSIARAEYTAWLWDVHGIHAGIHGNDAPPEVFQ